ncbi:hypothetical protein KQX54_015385 [Cotesia glomerata]|uniref:Uncharacterized protein n=1 Tax=Cotesia glomerata TaxID=32391 RepID=A0AAV7IWZ3_COTGL|nr:hypothetical protein KQX54_015385 [Cotesia glomerata]
MKISQSMKDAKVSGQQNKLICSFQKSSLTNVEGRFEVVRLYTSRKKRKVVESHFAEYKTMDIHRASHKFQFIKMTRWLYSQQRRKWHISIAFYNRESATICTYFEGYSRHIRIVLRCRINCIRGLIESLKTSVGDLRAYVLWCETSLEQFQTDFLYFLEPEMIKHKKLKFFLE